MFMKLTVKIVKLSFGLEKVFFKGEWAVIRLRARERKRVCGGRGRMPQLVYFNASKRKDGTIPRSS